MIKEQYRLLASVAVVKELYNSNMGIYDVLREFIREVLVRENREIVTLDEVTKALNISNGFKLPSSTVKSCMNNMSGVAREGKNTFRCDLKQISDYINKKKKHNTVENSVQDYEKKNQLLFHSLYSFLEIALKRKLTDYEKKCYKDSFCDFLIEDRAANSEYETQLFNRYVLHIAEDNLLFGILNDLKEGIILYEGICYSGDLSTLGAWNTELTIVCDTEVLFSICGYNHGRLQELWIQLEKYVKEINSNKKCKRINIAYFKETKEEIDAYFNMAERIVIQQDILDPTKEAMVQIVETCKNKGDVLAKKSEFYAQLITKGIKPIDKNFYDYSGDENNKKFNLESLSVLDIYSELWNISVEEVQDSARMLSHINVLRKGSSDKGFENCKYIFLTATGRTLRLSKAKDFYESGQVPLATTYDFLINYFWFKLNKGFGNGEVPRTIDMVLKARTVLAGILYNKAEEKFTELKEAYTSAVNSGMGFDKEYYKELYATLRENLKHPDDISAETIGDEITEMENWDFNKALANFKLREQELIEKDKEISDLKRQLDNNEQNKEYNKKELDYFQKKLADSNKANESYRLENKSLKIELEELKKKDMEENINKKTRKIRRRRIIFLLVAVGFCMLMGYGAYNDYSWVKVASGIGLAIELLSFAYNKLLRKNVDKKVGREAA